MEEVVVVETKFNKQRVSSSHSSENVNGERIESDLFFNNHQEYNCQVDLGSKIAKCCVPNCATSLLKNINSSQISFVTFPKDPSRFTEWMRAIERPDLLCYLGKKEAINLLICSKHFPENMWVNSNTRLKRLHKNAVPEISFDGDFDIIAITPVSMKNYARKGGLKVKKVSSLMTDSALRETLSSPVKNTSNTNNNHPVIDSSSSLKDITGRKLQTILPRPASVVLTNNTTPQILKRPRILSRTPKSPSLSNSELVKKLSTENNRLKGELDKNMDYILNQKTHYEGLLSKEKNTIKELESKVNSLENAQRKLWQSYESQIHTKKQTMDSKETLAKLKNLQNLNETLDKRLELDKQTISNLQAMNNELQSQVEELLEERDSLTTPQSPTSTSPKFNGENFKEFLCLHLSKERHLEEKIENLLLEIDQATPEGQKNNILNIASQHLNHLHLSWLKWILGLKNNGETDFDDRLREFALSIYEISKEAYVLCGKAFGLPSINDVEKMTGEISSSKRTTNSTINALFDKAESLPTKGLLNETSIDSDKEYGDVLEAKRKRKKSNQWEERCYSKKLKDDYDDDEEEGRVSDEDEEIFFTDSEDEEEEEEKGMGNNIVKAKKETIDSKDNILLQSGSKIEIPIPSTSSQDFDFMMEEELGGGGRGEAVVEPSSQSQAIEPRQQENDDQSMPLLDLDSAMAASRTEVNGNSADLKISNRKKVISSDTTLSSGSKVVFRVIES